MRVHVRLSHSTLELGVVVLPEGLPPRPALGFPLGFLPPLRSLSWWPLPPFARLAATTSSPPSSRSRSRAFLRFFLALRLLLGHREGGIPLPLYPGAVESRACRNASFFECFPYVCPEPVVAS